MLIKCSAWMAAWAMCDLQVRGRQGSMSAACMLLNDLRSGVELHRSSSGSDMRTVSLAPANQGHEEVKVKPEQIYEVCDRRASRSASRVDVRASFERH